MRLSSKLCRRASKGPGNRSSASTTRRLRKLPVGAKWRQTIFSKRPRNGFGRFAKFLAYLKPQIATDVALVYFLEGSRKKQIPSVVNSPIVNQQLHSSFNDSLIS